MSETVHLPKALAKRLERIAGVAHVSPEVIARAAIKERLDYLEWKERAVAEGQADIDAGRLVTTEQLCAELNKQRTHRAVKRKKAA
jgi:predicted transcriptional regulator